MTPGHPVKYRRCKRHDVPSHAHYLTFSCWRKLPFLDSDRARRWVLDALKAARDAHPFDLWAWVIMPQHLHLLIRPHESESISAILKSIKQPVAKTAVAWVQANAPHFLPRMEDIQPSGRRYHRFWQPGGGYDHNIYSVQELHEKAGYIHANPVRRKLVESPADWPWSSFRAWEEGIDEPIRIDRESLPAMERQSSLQVSKHGHPARDLRRDRN